LDAFWAIFLNLHHQLLKETRENIGWCGHSSFEKFTFFNLQYAAKNSYLEKIHKKNLTKNNLECSGICSDFFVFGLNKAGVRSDAAVFAVEFSVCLISAPKVVQTIQNTQVKQPPPRRHQFLAISPHSFAQFVNEPTPKKFI
jgi:hypothetical protein